MPGSQGRELVSRLGLRTTLGVLTELLASAQEHVVIAAPYIQGAEGLHAGPIGMALVAAVKRGVAVDVISTGASLSVLRLDPLISIPGARVRMLQPKDNVDDARMLGSHAKLLLCDKAHAYVGSANVTQRGISGNIEMGVLLHGAPAREVATFVEALLTSGYLLEANR